MVTVSNLIGNAWIRLENGELQPLEIGDRIPTDAEVITAPGATITLEADGLPPFIVGEDREMLLDPSLFDEADIDRSQFALPPLADAEAERVLAALDAGEDPFDELEPTAAILSTGGATEDRKSTRLNSSHVAISYAVFCLKKKTKETIRSAASQ